jgi:tripartite-type tricarboxylate transporter receptor subunit TctC
MSRTGLKMVGIPYRSTSEALAGVLSQSVDMTFESISVLLPLIREGKLRALAVTGRARSPFAPDVPTMMEAGVDDYEVTTFFGLVAPAGTPARIVGLLNATMNEALATPQMQQTISALGAAPQAKSPADFGDTIAANLNKWRTLGQVANIRIN